MAMFMSCARALATLATWSLAVFVSAQVDDSFTDGDFTTGPAWTLSLIHISEPTRPY